MKKTICILLTLVMIFSMTFSSLAVGKDSENNGKKIANLIESTVKTIIAKLTDIETHWAKNIIHKLVSLGTINGYEDGTFKPNHPITVGEFIKILTTSLGYKDVEISKEGHWSLNYVEKLKELGIIKEGEFSIDDLKRPINRGEMARMIARAIQEDDPENIDTYARQIKDYNNIPPEYQKHVLKAYVHGIIAGYTDGTFQYEKSATRAEASAMIVRLLDPKERKVPELQPREDIIVINGQEIEVEDTAVIPYIQEVEKILDKGSKHVIKKYNGIDGISLTYVPNEDSKLQY